MKIIFHNLKDFSIVLFMLTFFGVVNAQTYTITGNVNASTLSCSTFGSNNIISIGNGTTPSNLIMNGDLDLRSCFLGPIQMIINNATVDFTTDNKRLFLPEGSSIVFVNGGTLNPNGSVNGGGCTGNDRIYIGNFILASCNGNVGSVGFDDLIDFGGTGSAISNSPICSGSTITFSATPPPKGGAYTFSWSGPNGFTSTAQNPTVTNSSLASAGTYSVIMTSTTLSPNKSITVQTTVVVNSGSGPAAPTIGTTTQPTCSVFTGSVVLNGLPASGTWTLTRNPGVLKTTGTGTSTTISGLTSGTYTFTVSNGTCTSGASGNVVVNATTNTWNGTSWLSGTPISTQAITFNGNYDSTGDLTACSCTVNTGKKVTIKSGHNLIITNGVTVSGTGTLTFEDSASLVQTNNVTNTGNITYKRYANIRNTDYTYWSSPVAGYTLGGVSQNKTLSDKYYSYNPTIDNWQQESAATIMTTGIGYIVRGPEPITTPPLPPPPGLYEASFVGVPNNGNISVSGNIADRSYLLGNPYPSAINADKFLTANAGVLNGTLYFWTHRTPIGVGVSNPGTGTFAYSGDDYAVYNATGGVGAAPPDLDPLTGSPYPGSSPSGSEKPNGYISVGQGFFASTQVAPSSSSIVFDNSMREAGGTTLPDGTKINQQFFKTKNSNTKTIEKNRVWLNLTNAQGAFKQTLIGYLTDATNEYDSRFDGESFDGNEYVDFYSVNQDKNLTIQGRALPFDENDEVPLGFRSTIEGPFSISIDQVDGSLTNQPIFIEDKLTNTVFDLKRGNYTFNTVSGTFNDRFVLRYTNKTLGKDQVELNDGIIALYSNNYRTLIIRNNVNDATVNAVELFNLLGQSIANWEVDDSEQINIQIPIKNTSSGIYIVKIKTTKGEFSKKIVIK